MREEYALDHLVTNDVEPADVEWLVPNPVKKEKRKLIKKLKRELEFSNSSKFFTCSWRICWC